MRFLADDLFEHPLDLNDRLVTHPSATFFMRRGADLLIVDRALDPKPGDQVVAIVDGELKPRTVKLGESLEVWGIITYEIRSLGHR